MLLVKIAGGLVLLVLIGAFFLRGRGGARRTKVAPNVRPTPPSPYKPSRGFRILDGSESEAPHEVRRPRLDPNKEFVFNDPVASANEALSAPHLRHDERWALDRSMRRAPHPRVRRRRWAWAVLVVVLAAALIAVLLWPHHPSAHHGARASAYALAPSSWMM